MGRSEHAHGVTQGTDFQLHSVTVKGFPYVLRPHALQNQRYDSLIFCVRRTAFSFCHAVLQSNNMRDLLNGNKSFTKSLVYRYVLVSR